MKKALAILLLIYSSLAQPMDVKLGIGSSNIIFLTGMIENGDLEKIYSIIRSNGYPYEVWIESPGGNVEESLKIGRFFNKAFIEVNAVKQCDSACFFIWAGAYRRETSTALGLHRPYFKRDYFSGLSANQAKNKYQRLSKMVKKYLIEMAVPATYIDSMMSADSENIYYIQSEDFSGVISEYAPAQREWIISKCGALSKDEKQDYGASVVYKKYQEWGDSDPFSIVLKNIRGDELEHGKNLSAGYVSYLEKKAYSIAQCKSNSIENVRSTIELY